MAVVTTDRMVFALTSGRSALAPSRSQAWPPVRWNPRRVAQGIDGGVDLGVQPAFASPDCLVLVFLLTALALC
jgi:hypothetical protein